MNFRIVVMLLLVFVLFGCATSYNSLRQSRDDGMTIIMCNKNEILPIMYQSISNVFPDSQIDKMDLGKIGYSWANRPFLDTTRFDLQITPTSGVDDNGNKIDGVTYSVSTFGSQWGVSMRYVSPLNIEIRKELIDANIKTAHVIKITNIE